MQLDRQVKVMASVLTFASGQERDDFATGILVTLQLREVLPKGLRVLGGEPIDLQSLERQG
jgi:hypothetical protein